MYAASQVPSTSSGMDDYVQPKEMKQIQAKVIAGNFHLIDVASFFSNFFFGV